MSTELQLQLASPRRNLLLRAAAVALLTVAGMAVVVPSSPARAAARPDIKPLPANLEQRRATEADQLYGSPEIRPIEERKTGLITMGDSEISGEGIGNYDAGTHQDGNWCDRSPQQAVFKVTIEADVRYNVACSGGEPQNLIYGGDHQWNELNQGDNLAIRARNTHLKLVWVVVGANGEGSIEFGPVASSCVANRFLFLGACYPDYTDEWATRITVSQSNVEAALRSIRQTMTDAGYLQSDYELVLQSYPSPVSPDVEDNPNFPGWYEGGCLVYLADAAFARNKAVPMFEWALRAAAASTGTRYLDDSRLFSGLEPCSDYRAVRGFFIELGVWNENAVRQSLHPNSHGHVMFAECMDQFFASGQPQGTCVDNASTHHGTLVNGLLTFKQFRNAATGNCLDADHYNSRNGTALISSACHGGRNQGFWYDEQGQGLHVELSHDRCLDIKDGNVTENKPVQLWDCRVRANQKWVVDGQAVHPASRSDLCLDLNTDSVPKAKVTKCTGSTRQQWSFEVRNFANPVGYGHGDFIGSRVY